MIGDPAAAYRVGQILFHDDLALYNELWQGQQRSFYAFDGAIDFLAAGDLQPQWLVQFRGMNTYIAAEPIFAAIAADRAAPADLRAKAAYSAAECLVHMDGYNAVNIQTVPQSSLRDDIVAAFRAFARQYPHDGELTADALLTVTRYTRDPADVAVIRQRFPNTWQATAAAGVLSGTGAVLPQGGSQLAYERLPAADIVPGSGNSSAPGGDVWTTVRPAPTGLPNGTGVTIYRLVDVAPGKAKVVWALDRGLLTSGLPWVRSSLVAVVRIPAVLPDVSCVQQSRPW